MFVFKVILGLLFAHLAKVLGESPAIGLILGVFIGHLLDSMFVKKLHEWQYLRKYKKAAQQKANADFLFCFFTLAGKVCSSDNSICEIERKKISEITTDRLNLGRRDRKTAIKYFNNSIKYNVPPQTLAVRLHELCYHTPQMLENTVLLLRELAECDGQLNKAETDILFTLSTVFGFDQATSQKLTSNIGSKGFHSSHRKNNNTGSSDKKNNDQIKTTEGPLAKHLQTLGCSSQDSNEKIKQKYRELVAKFHPDKIQSKELPQDFVDFAKDRFTEIRCAYEEVRRLKGF
ncbi:MAG TPA: DnaJ domain-containing protein [Oligoflexia bacterium]|nr:DnaJ domain-containing protein [Oligoflexia bacterium]HMP49187.1 DnaJ domain-containing protein [Oligoflexia bacterium]